MPAFTGPRHLAVLGAGVMGSALLSALVDQGAYDAAHVRATTVDEPTRARLAEQGFAVVSNTEAVAAADVVLVAVKPDAVAALLAEVADALPEDAVIVSVAAGVGLSTLTGALRSGQPVVRVMPNTPALVGEGMLAMSPGPTCTPDQAARVADLLSACGSVVSVPEKLQDAVTGLSGSGPAYVFAFTEALIEAGVQQGLPRPVATELAVQTLYGAATLLRRGGEHPTLLREQVTSPGGTTAAGLRALDAAGLRAGVADAVEAATRRSRELGGP